MTTFIKSVGCSCPECGSIPCDPGCACTFFESDNWVAPGGSTSYDITGQLVVGNNVRCVANPDVGASTFRISGTVGATSFDSGYLSYPTVFNDTIFVPAGGTTISVTVEVSGAGGANVTVEFECLGP